MTTKVYDCSFCDYTTQSKDAWYQHRHRKHTEIIHKIKKSRRACQYCTKIMSTKSNLNAHEGRCLLKMKKLVNDRVRKELEKIREEAFEKMMEEQKKAAWKTPRVVMNDGRKGVVAGRLKYLKDEGSSSEWKEELVEQGLIDKSTNLIRVFITDESSLTDDATIYSRLKQFQNEEGVKYILEIILLQSGDCEEENETEEVKNEQLMAKLEQIQ